MRGGCGLYGVGRRGQGWGRLCSSSEPGAWLRASRRPDGSRRGRQAFGANVPRHPPAANASSLISPRRPAGRVGLRIADLPESQAPRFCVWVATQVGRGCECPWGRNKGGGVGRRPAPRSEEHTSELQSLMRISYAVFCLKKKK